MQGSRAVDIIRKWFESDGAADASVRLIDCERDESNNECNPTCPAAKAGSKVVQPTANSGQQRTESPKAQPPLPTLSSDTWIVVVLLLAITLMFVYIALKRVNWREALSRRRPAFH